MNNFIIEQSILVEYTGKEQVVKIPDTVTHIGAYAFRGCDMITAVEIPDSVTEIMLEAFRDCTNLTSIKIPNV